MPSEGEDSGVGEVEGEGEGAGKVMPASKCNINYMKQRPREKLMPADHRHSREGKGRGGRWVEKRTGTRQLLLIMRQLTYFFYLAALN